MVARAPHGLLQPIGAPVQIDSLVLATYGTDRIGLTLSSPAPITLSPATVSLVPGASSTIKMTPVPPTAPFFLSTFVKVSIAGTLYPFTIPMTVAAVNAPSAPVKASATRKFILTSGLASQTRQANWSLANGGTVPLDGILTTDVPWLIPQTGVINIGAKSSTTVSFTTDPGGRNSIAPLGALTGTLGFLYAGGSPPVARVEATVVDISNLPVLRGEPPVAAAGETIVFLPVFGEPGGITNDIFFANRGADRLSSYLRLFYTPAETSAAASLIAIVGSLAANQTVWFPFAPASIFSASATGTVQVRSTDPAVASAVYRSITPDGTNLYTTAVPVLRSDRAVASGDQLVFAGVENSATAGTEFFLQETTGAGGTYTIEFYDAAGGLLGGTRSGSIPPFGSENLRDAAPQNARSARLKNTSTSSARLAGFAAVVDRSTLDSWTIVDMTAGQALKADLVLPVPADMPKGSAFSAWVTNIASSPVLVWVGSDVLPTKSRAVRQSPAGGNSSAQPIVLAAGETREVPVAGAPYVHISASSNAIRANGRLTTSVSGRVGSFGTGVPAIPSALAAGAGGAESHFFRARDQAGVEPMTLMLLEVAKKPATVRVTVGFSFPAGSTQGTHLETSRDFEVAAGQLLSVPDVLRAVTSARDAYGDVINVAIDVQVIGGEGRVLSYAQSDASGDLTLTAN